MQLKTRHADCAREPATTTMGYSTQHLPVTIKKEHSLLFAVRYSRTQPLCHVLRWNETEAFRPIRKNGKRCRGLFSGKLFKNCGVTPAIFASLLGCKPP